MKYLLNGIALVALIFFRYGNVSAQNITGNNPSTISIETLVETSSTVLQASKKTVKLIRGDGINAYKNISTKKL